MEDDKIGALAVVGTQELIDKAVYDADRDLYEEEAEDSSVLDSLSSHIHHEFQINKDARRTSGIDDDIFDSSRAFNGKYSTQDLTNIQASGGSTIFMNLTATKCRAACSWIRDILLSPKFKPWSLSPTPKPNLPSDIEAMIEDAITKEFSSLTQPKPVEQQPQGKPKSPVKEAQDTIRTINQNKRDIKDAFAEEIFDQAKYELKKVELEITDQLAEGGWDDALSTFIEDFTVYPTAFMKGPVITKSHGLSWEKGEAVVTAKYKYLNKRVSPIDIYPSPNATGINDGNLIEHIRLSRKELHDLIGVPKYKESKIRRILTDATMGVNSHFSSLDTGIESDKADGEKRGTEFDANRDVLHGLHYFGSAPASKLREWGMGEEDLNYADDIAEFEIEAILVESEVIKCCINADPLNRRPYYKASWHNIPGAFWGKSLPSLMDSDQRMCNAAARALANNMGIASGPQVEIYTDRLADSGAIDEITPFKIWQMTSDPTGAGGRAITWHNIPSNANELMAVYKEFELKADNSTGIPQYAYGNERSGGAAQTAQGLSMLLESASKSIKDAIRNIDKGCIKPRIEYQFYWHMKTSDVKYTGDINVLVTGSSALTVHGAEQLRRNEFLQQTSNPTDMQIIGLEGRATLLREIASDLNLSENIVPSRLVLRKKEDENKEQAQAQAEAEAKKANKSVEATTIQIEGQKAMHQGTLESKKIDQSLKADKQQVDQQIEVAKLQGADKRDTQRVQLEGEKVRLNTDQKDLAQKREIALKLKVGEGI